MYGQTSLLSFVEARKGTQNAKRLLPLKLAVQYVGEI